MPLPANTLANTKTRDGWLHWLTRYPAPNAPIEPVAQTGTSSRHSPQNHVLLKSQRNAPHMSHLSFTQTHQNALRELTRLTEIKNRLAGLIIDLKQTEGADIWVREYTLRLKENILPAIAEVKAYINSQELKVTKTSN